jgi:hypothetical protein
MGRIGETCTGRSMEGEYVQTREQQAKDREDGVFCDSLYMHGRCDRSLSYFPLGPCSKPALLTIKDCLQREVVLGETCRESIAKHADVEGFRSAHERDICALKRSHGVEPCFFVNGTVLPLIKDFHNVVCTCRAGQQKPG